MDNSDVTTVLIRGDSAIGNRYKRSPRTIYNWRQQGFPYETDPNDPTVYLYDPVKTDEWFYTSQDHGDDSDLDALAIKAQINREKLRKLTAEANQSEREDELAEGNVLDREAYELFAAETIQESRDAILRVPAYFGAHLCKKCQPKLEELTRQLEAALKSLARLSDGPNADD